MSRARCLQGHLAQRLDVGIDGDPSVEFANAGKVGHAHDRAKVEAARSVGAGEGVGDHATGAVTSGLRLHSPEAVGLFLNLVGVGQHRHPARRRVVTDRHRDATEGEDVGSVESLPGAAAKEL